MHTNGQTRSDYKYIIDPKSYYNESSMFFPLFFKYASSFILQNKMREYKIKQNFNSVKKKVS